MRAFKGESVFRKSSGGEAGLGLSCTVPVPSEEVEEEEGVYCYEILLSVEAQHLITSVVEQFYSLTGSHRHSIIFPIP